MSSTAPELPLRLAQRTARIDPFRVMELVKRARDLERAGRSIIHLSIGEPDFTAAPGVVQALKTAVDAGHTGYTAALGVQGLREAIARHAGQAWDADLDPSRIVVTAGASAALLLACCALVDPGAQVLMADPCYPCNRHFVSAFDGVPVTIPVGPASRFQLDAATVDAHWSDAVRGVLLATPSNPTGTSIEWSELQRLVEVSRARGGFTLVDEIYLDLSYGHRPRSAISMGSDVLVAGSCSKFFHMTGWRLGWLAETLGLEPAAETQHLLDTPEAAAAAPAPRDDAAFVGRRQEQRELAALVAQPGCRWVTIVGAGGTGKTTLLRHALPELASIAGVDPLWVSFEDVPSPAAAAQRLAEALGLRVAPQGDALAGVAAQLADRRLLLALDNLEHLADTARALAAALAAGPGVRVVVTSRMRLGVPDEWLLPLQGLPWPGPEDADRAESFDAVRLFNARARRHRPSFNAAAERLAVAQLCAAVEGLPLALAMAAAWTRQFAVADLVAELQRGAVDVLQTAEPGVTPRQASIEACLDHSWQLLVPAERQVLARLTVFAGSFTAESARLVAGATLPLLAALLDKSLVQRTPDDTRRLALHPLTSDFVRRRATVDELDAARRAHAGFFLQQLSHMPPAERPAERAAFFDAAEADAGNLMQAWQHACVHGPADGLAAATVGFFSHLFAQGRFATGLAALRAAEPALAGQPLALARLRSTQALMARSTADLTFAHEALRAALPVARRHRDGKVVRACLSALADVLMLLGRATESRSATREMQRLAERDGDRNVVAIALMSLSIIDNDAGRHAAALAALRRAHAIVEELGQSQASVMQQIGTTLRLAGQPQRAVDELGAFLAGHGHETPAHWRAALLYPMAEAELELGEVDAAAARVAEARAAHAEGHWPVLDIALALLGSRIDLARGRVEAARAGLQQAAAGVRRVDTRPLQHTLALNAGLWLRAAGQVDAAHELLSALLAQPNLATPLRREARSLGARPAADAPPLMPLLERLLPF